jgi:hypothetical protein
MPPLRFSSERMAVPVKTMDMETGAQARGRDISKTTNVRNMRKKWPKICLRSIYPNVKWPFGRRQYGEVFYLLQD